jgi:DNA-binding CsgD family transcriptional regulator
MGIFTDREKEIMKLLSEGKRTSVIAKDLDTNQTTISRALKNIRIKAIDIERDVEFMMEIGYIQIRANKLCFASDDKNPKAIRKSANTK